MPVSVSLDWSGASAVCAQPANAVLVHGIGEELVLSFGHAVPPIETATMTPEQMSEHLEANDVAVRQVVRFTLPLSTARTLLTGLTKALSDRAGAAETAEAAS